MAHTIFILGTDAQQNKELQEFLQERVAETGEKVVVTDSKDVLPPLPNRTRSL